jgi:orotate phosphoribosyltransferase
MERQDGSLMTARRETEEACGVRIHAIVTLEDIINALEKGIIASTEYLSDIRRYKETYGGNIYGD